MNSISNVTLERLELYKKISKDVVDKIENSMTYVETLLIYEILNSNIYNKDKMFFNYQLFSKLTIKKYSKLYEEELKTLKKSLVSSLESDLKYTSDRNISETIVNMIDILNKPIEQKFSEKCNIMIENFKESLEEIIQNNSNLIPADSKKLEYIEQQNMQKEVEREKAKAKEVEREKAKEAEEEFKEKMRLRQEEIRRKEEEIRLQKEKIAKENNKIEKENQEIESMLGAIDNIYDEMSDANLSQIDYTTFLKYIEEEDVSAINLDNIIKTNNEDIQINESLSKTLDDLDLGSEQKDILEEQVLKPVLDSNFDENEELLNSINLELGTEMKENTLSIPKTLDEIKFDITEDEIEEVDGSTKIEDNLFTEEEYIKNQESVFDEEELEKELESLLADKDSSISTDVSSEEEKISKVLDSMKLDDKEIEDIENTFDEMDFDIEEELSSNLEDEIASEILSDTNLDSSDILSSMDLDDELLNTLNLEEEKLEQEDNIDSDTLDDIDSFLEEISNKDEEKEKKGKFGRLKFGFKNKQ